jgi:multidrug resistance efflux pump
VTVPYDGIVTVRNINTGDYVPAVSGDKPTPNPSAMFVVASTDRLRVFVDVPEEYASYVQKGTKVVVRDVALGLQILATVTRTSWAIRERKGLPPEYNSSEGYTDADFDPKNPQYAFP